MKTPHARLGRFLAATALGLLAPPLLAIEPATPTPESPVQPAALPAAENLQELHASLLRLGENKLAEGDLDAARIAFETVGRESEDPAASVAALHGLARTYRSAGHLVRAVATLEHILADYPGNPLIPLVLLDLGRTLRELGSPRLALARFYSVLHSTLKLPAASASAYRRIARTAQFEIAQTHSIMGNHAEAARFYERLDLLDLAPVDRARARFQAAVARVHTGDRRAAIAALEQFLRAEPDSTFGPEARFLLATTLAEDERPAEALAVTLELLREAQRLHGADTATWRTWQRRTGNQLANDFFQRGDFLSALRLYEALATLDPDPAWRLPVLYQVGLCLERLLRYDEAATTYRIITDLTAAEPAEIIAMARWRLEQLDWWSRTNQHLKRLHPSTATESPPLS